MRRGFTMIELIFVIVIIGILAAVAIPKMMTTRDDAIVAKELSNIKQAIANLQAEYTSQDALASQSITEQSKSISCFTIAANTAGTGITITQATPAGKTCSATAAEQLKIDGVANGILNTGGATKEIIFQGVAVRR